MANKTPTPDDKSVGQISLFGPRETPDAFRKAVQAIHSMPLSPLSLVQRKLGNAWLKHAISTQPAEDGFWELSIKDLSIAIGFDSKNIKYMKDAAKALMGVRYEWDILAPPNKRVAWKASILFPEVEIETHVVRYQISGQMREHMLKPDMYALIDMNVVRRFRRASSLAIWEFCIRFEKIGQTAEMEWEKFRDMTLGESKDSQRYLQYKYFKSQSLLPSIAEINSQTDHTISLQETKLGGRITKLRFEVKKKRREAETVDDEGDTSAVELISEMVKVGMPTSEAKKLCGQEDRAKIRGALDYTKRRLSDKKLAKIDNPAAYFRQALSHGYAGEIKSASKEGLKTTAKKQPVDIKESYRAHQLVEAERYFKELDATDQAATIDQYNLQQTTPLLKLSKKAKKGAQIAFYAWLATKTWGEPSYEELLEFAQTILLAK